MSRIKPPSRDQLILQIRNNGWEEDAFDILGRRPSIPVLKEYIERKGQETKSPEHENKAPEATISVVSNSNQQ